MEQKGITQTGCTCNCGKKGLKYEGTVGMDSHRVYPVLLPCLLAPVLPELTAHSCEEDQQPLLEKRPGRYRLLFDQNMHFQHLLQAKTCRLQDDMRQNMRRYQNEKVRLQEQLSMLHNELLENQSTTSTRSEHSISKDYRHYGRQMLTHRAKHSGFEMMDTPEYSQRGSVNITGDQYGVTGLSQSPNFFNDKLLRQTRYSSINKAKIGNRYPNNKNREVVHGSSNSNGQRRQSGFNQSKYLPPLGTKSSLKKLEWQSGRNLDPRVPNKGTELVPVSKAIMDYKDKDRRIFVSRQSSFTSSRSPYNATPISRQSYINKKNSVEVNPKSIIRLETEKHKQNVGSKNEKSEGFLTKTLKDTSVLKSNKINLRQHLTNQLETKMREVKIQSDNQIAGGTKLSKSGTPLQNKPEQTNDGNRTTAKTHVHKKPNIFADTINAASYGGEDFDYTQNTLQLPQLKILDEERHNTAPKSDWLAREEVLVTSNDCTVLPHISKPHEVVTRKNITKLPLSNFRQTKPNNFIQGTNGGSPSSLNKDFRSENRAFSPEDLDEYESVRIFPKVIGSNSKLVVPQITIRPASKTGELKRLESLLNLNTSTASLSSISKKHEDPTEKWKALYMKITDPAKRTQMLTDIVFSVREKMRENEHQLKYGVNPKSLITHNTLCDFLLFKPRNNNKPTKKPQKMMPLPTHTAQRSARRSTSSQLQDYLRRSVKSRPMIEHLQAEEYRLMHYAEKQGLNDM